MARGKGTKIPGLKRKPKREGGYFDELPDDQRRLAEYHYRRLRERWQGIPVGRWLRPLLVGQARRLAKNPPDSAWGRSMAAKKGGYAVQKQYRMEGRDPTAKATRVRQARQGKPVKPRPDYPVQAKTGGTLASNGECISIVFDPPDPLSILTPDMREYYKELQEEMDIRDGYY